jgi:hypothetical protein
VIGLGCAWALMAVGVWLVFGFGWGLIVAGAELAVYFLVPYDVDRPLPTAVRTDLPGPLRRFAALPDDEEAGL